MDEDLEAPMHWEDHQAAQYARTLLEWPAPHEIFQPPRLPVAAILDVRRGRGTEGGITLVLRIASNRQRLEVLLSEDLARQLTQRMRRQFPYERITGDWFSSAGGGTHPADVNMPPDPDAASEPAD